MQKKSLALLVFTIFLSAGASRATEYKECNDYEYAFYRSTSNKAITLTAKNPASNKAKTLPATIQSYLLICKFFKSETKRTPDVESKNPAHFEVIWCSGELKGLNECERQPITLTDSQKKELYELLNNSTYKAMHGGGVLKKDNTSTLGAQWDRYIEEARKNRQNSN